MCKWIIKWTTFFVKHKHIILSFAQHMTKYHNIRTNLSQKSLIFFFLFVFQCWFVGIIEQIECKNYNYWFCEWRQFADFWSIHWKKLCDIEPNTRRLCLMNQTARHCFFIKKIWTDSFVSKNEQVQDENHDQHKKYHHQTENSNKNVEIINKHQIELNLQIKIVIIKITT